MKISSAILLRSITVLVFLLTFPGFGFGQYFGQNLVRYKNEKFKVLQTPHFDIYYYIKNEKLLKKFSQEAETWYKMHQEIFRDTFLKKNPIILYNNHPDFQQTTALIGGAPTVGTGGVTEAFKNRIIMPVLDIYSQTRHVLGHEMVHAFQYRMLMEKDSISLENINNIPLWMVEGMAEYLSVGKKDAFTSMWMRDAMLNLDIPSLKDLTNTNKYFPYRYGQAFWSFVGSLYGDTTIMPLFKATARFGYENGIKYTFGFDDKTLSGLWKNAIEQHYRPILKSDSSQIKITGTKILDNKNAGKMNLAPAISPDGKYVAFLSENILYGIDLLLADAKTGKILRKLSNKSDNSHIDEFNFIESAGTWSPNGTMFAFSIFSKGKNRIMIIDVKSGKTILQTDMGKVESFSNLTWSPNGKEIAFSGMIEGQSDIFAYHLDTKKVIQITNDEYSDYAPNYSPDGSKIVFSSDRASIKSGNIEAVNPMNLTVYDFNNQTFTDINVFKGANNLNAQFSSDSKRIFFLSNRDGFRNLYEYNLTDQSVKQLTDYFTGISGITEFSPAFSVSRHDDIVYSYYRYQRYTIYNSPANYFKAKPVDINDINFETAILPPSENKGVDIVNSNLTNFDRFEKIGEKFMTNVPYRPKFKLDYITKSDVGIGISRFGAMQGGVVGIFSDILGRNQIVANIAVNGEIYDFGGMGAYINQKNRINWGLSYSHIPYLTGFRSYNLYQRGSAGEPIDTISTNILRTFEDKLELFGSYPFNKIHRFELGSAFALYYYRLDRYNNYYNQYGYIGSNRERNVNTKNAGTSLGIPLNNFFIYQVNASFVGDNSVFGMTGPIDGFRYRIGIEENMGDYNFVSIIADARKYIRVKPFTFAFRSHNRLRFGKDSEKLYPLYVGYNYLIRGYEANSLTSNDTFDIYQLAGSKTAVFNFEIRLPFTGPKKIAQIPSKFLFSDLNLFFDAGVAWTKDSHVVLKSRPKPIYEANNSSVERVPVVSTGISLRVNLFNALILEPYYAIRLQRKKNINLGVFGVTFSPGW